MMNVANVKHAERVYNFLTNAGLNHVGAAALMGNLYAESGLNPECLQTAFQKTLGYTGDTYTEAVDSGDYGGFADDRAGYGLAQWTYSTRKTALLKFARQKGGSVRDLELQLQFLLSELRESYAVVWNTLKSAVSVRTASDTVLLYYERSADTGTAVQERRAAFAQAFLEYFTLEEGDDMSKTVSTGWITDTINGIPVNTKFPCHSGNYNAVGGRTITHITAHYTGNRKDTAFANANYFHSRSGTGASAHFFVDETAIYQSVRLSDVAWHSGNRDMNWKSIGVEMCCSGNYRISEKTKRNAAHLFAYLCRLTGITADMVDTRVNRHYDVTGKLCPAQMAGKNNAEWTAFRQMIKDILREGVINPSTPAVTSGSTEKPAFPAVPFTAKITCKTLNVRSGPGTAYAISAEPVTLGEVFTIIDTSANGWAS